MMNNSRLLAIEMNKAKILIEQVKLLSGDDADFIRDTIEGETSLFEILDALVSADGEDESLIASMAAYIERVCLRMDRVKKRKEIRMGLIGLALELAETRSRETPSGLVFVKKVSPSAIITEEAEIPAKFWKAQPPKMMKKEITAALKAGENVSGATLSNGGTTIQIKRT